MDKNTFKFGPNVTTVRMHMYWSEITMERHIEIDSETVSSTIQHQYTGFVCCISPVYKSSKMIFAH